MNDSKKIAKKTKRRKTRKKPNKNKVLVFTAPSGAGKTTVVHHLLDEYRDRLGFSVSATTRQKRKHERGGKDYYFIDKDTFLKSIENNDFVEWQEVYKDQFYGTLKSELERLWKKGKTVVFDIDVKGAENIKKYFGEDALVVFIAPPSIETLIDRLKDRGTESESSLKKRIDRIKKELEYEDKFDKVLVNKFLPETYREAERIVEEFLG
ncbi:MAG TPA: guanylate kinase, partial [Bacteroidetes bacterium]|nr:guanylate kinase [Bacteroidota bacterium]